MNLLRVGDMTINLDWVRHTNYDPALRRLHVHFGDGIPLTLEEPWASAVRVWLLTHSQGVEVQTQKEHETCLSVGNTVFANRRPDAAMEGN